MTVALKTIDALMPRDETGQQFVIYGDCCSGIPGAEHERYFAAVNAVLMRLSPPPSWICFAGDEVMGMTKDYVALREQWRYWQDHEMAWLDSGACPVYHVPSNHTAYDVPSEAVWKQANPDVPSNGPPGQEGLSYYIRRGNLLVVFMDTSFSGLGGNGHVEHEWLDSVLTSNKDALYKMVVGHYPAHAVNGYDEYPRWRIVPDQADAFWKALVRHKVLAYLCSHVIAFDVQAHDGVLQITTGGAGTRAGPGGFMPGQTEYHHLVQMAVDRKGIRYQVLDEEGKPREWLSWPLSLTPSKDWLTLLVECSPYRDPIPLKIPKDDASTESQGSAQPYLTVWRFTGVAGEGRDDQTLLSGSNFMDGPATLWVGTEAGSQRLMVRLQPVSGGGVETWTGPSLRPGRTFDFQVAVHAGMGPGGVLYRDNDGSEWSTMKSASARGAELLVWPERWIVGHGPSGTLDAPFTGTGLRISSSRQQ